MNEAKNEMISSITFRALTPFFIAVAFLDVRQQLAIRKLLLEEQIRNLASW